MSDRASDQLELRPAEATDEERLFLWRNLPSIIELGSLKREVSRAEHSRWFEESLKGAARNIFIIFWDKEPIGQLRFDYIDSQKAEISIYILPAFTGRGIGVLAIEKGCYQVLEKHPSIQIIAWIKEDNSQSVTAFRKARFFPDLSNEQRPKHCCLVWKQPEPIPHNRLTFGEEEAVAMAQVVISGRWSGGKVLAELETSLATQAGVAHAVGVGSGFAALRLSLGALGICRGDKVALPAYSCVALPNAVLACGAEPVAVDVDPDTWNLSVSALEKTLARIKGVKAVIAVHTFGSPAPIKELKALGLPVIEDCSHAFGRPPFGQMGDLTILSLYATKLLGAGEGGMIFTQNAQMAERVLFARDYTDKPPSAWRMNDKMTDLEATLGKCQLMRLPYLLSRREELARRYTALFSSKIDKHNITLPFSNKGRIWYRYAVKVPNAREIAERMKYHGVMAAQPVENWLGDVPEFSVAMKAHQEILSIPLFPNLTSAEQDQVVSALLTASSIK